RNGQWKGTRLFILCKITDEEERSYGTIYRSRLEKSSSSWHFLNWNGQRVRKTPLCPRTTRCKPTKKNVGIRLTASRKTKAPLHVRFKRTPIPRSEEHTSELQSRFDLVCRLLL